MPLLFSAAPSHVDQARTSGFLLLRQEVQGNGEGDQWLTTSPVGILEVEEPTATTVAARLSAAVAPLELHLVGGAVEIHPAYRIQTLPRFVERDARMVSIQRGQRVVTVDPRTRERTEVLFRETLEVPALYEPHQATMRLYTDAPEPDVYVFQVEHHDPELAEAILKVGLASRLQEVPLALHAVLLEAFRGQRVVEIGEVGLWMAPDGHPMVLPPEGESTRLVQALLGVQEGGLRVRVRGRTYGLPVVGELGDG